MRDTNQNYTNLSYFRFSLFPWCPIIKSMHKEVVRQPIHPRKANRGKLRKIEYHRLNANPIRNELMLTPTDIISSNHDRKQKIHLFFKKQEQAQGFSFFSEPSGGQQLSGSFRAIHTAHPDDSIRGFPLRCITPIKPFRRGIRSTSKVTKHTFDISPKEGCSIKSSRRQVRQHHNLSAMIIKPPPCLIDNQEVEEFYKIKDDQQDFCLFGSKDKQGGKLAGSKIQPFKKYQIRDVQRGTLSSRSYHSQKIVYQ